MGAEVVLPSHLYLLRFGVLISSSTVSLLSCSQFAPIINLVQISYLPSPETNNPTLSHSENLCMEEQCCEAPSSKGPWEIAKTLIPDVNASQLLPSYHVRPAAALLLTSLLLYTTSIRPRCRKLSNKESSTVVLDVIAILAVGRTSRITEKPTLRNPHTTNLI